MGKGDKDKNKRKGGGAHKGQPPKRGRQFTNEHADMLDLLSKHKKKAEKKKERAKTVERTVRALKQGATSVDDIMDESSSSSESDVDLFESLGHRSRSRTRRGHKESRENKKEREQAEEVVRLKAELATLKSSLTRAPEGGKFSSDEVLKLLKTAKSTGKAATPIKQPPRAVAGSMQLQLEPPNQEQYFPYSLFDGIISVLILRLGR